MASKQSGQTTLTLSGTVRKAVIRPPCVQIKVGHRIYRHT